MFAIAADSTTLSVLSEQLLFTTINSTSYSSGTGKSARQLSVVLRLSARLHVQMIIETSIVVFEDSARKCIESIVCGLGKFV